MFEKLSAIRLSLVWSVPNKLDIFDLVLPACQDFDLNQLIMCGWKRNIKEDSHVTIRKNVELTYSPSGNRACAPIAVRDQTISSQHLYQMSSSTRKPVFGVCGQARFKLSCAAKEARKKLEILCLETRGIILSRQRKTNALIRLCGCTGWSAPLLFAHAKTGFLMTRLE